MFYTWDFMRKEISVTSKMFYFMVPPYQYVMSVKQLKCPINTGIFQKINDSKKKFEETINVNNFQLNIKNWVGADLSERSFRQIYSGHLDRIGQFDGHSDSVEREVTLFDNQMVICYLVSKYTLVSIFQPILERQEFPIFIELARKLSLVRARNQNTIAVHQKSIFKPV